MLDYLAFGQAYGGLSRLGSDGEDPSTVGGRNPWAKILNFVERRKIGSGEMTRG